MVALGDPVQEVADADKVAVIVTTSPGLIPTHAKHDTDMQGTVPDVREFMIFRNPDVESNPSDEYLSFFSLVLHTSAE